MNCISKSRRLQPPKPYATSAIAGIQWPSFTGQGIFVGNSPSGRVAVYVDAAGGPAMAQNATDLLADADRIVKANDAIFGTTSGSVNVIVFALGGQTDGTGGADHNGCDFTTGQNIEVCAAFGNSMRVSALFEAELSECCMNGNLCGMSTGEALSRWCAAVVGNNALADFATAPAWVQAGMPDWVSRTEATDQNPVSTGCGMAFISWLLATGWTLGHIAQLMVRLGDNGTLAQLTTLPTAFATFKAAVLALPNGVTNDDPFGGIHPPPPPPPPPPPQPTGSFTMKGGFDAALKILIAREVGNRWAQRTLAQVQTFGDQVLPSP